VKRKEIRIANIFKEKAKNTISRKITWEAINFIDSTILLASELAEALSSYFQLNLESN
jgi:hypothetical protein